MFILYVYCIKINFLALIPACSGLFDEYPRVQNHLPECSNYNNAHKYTVSITTTLTNTRTVLLLRSQIHGQYYCTALTNTRLVLLLRSQMYGQYYCTALINTRSILLHCAYKYPVNVVTARITKTLPNPHRAVIVKNIQYYKPLKVC